MLAGELAESLRAVAGELDRALCEDTLEEQTAALLRMPRVPTEVKPLYKSISWNTL